MVLPFRLLLLGCVLCGALPVGDTSGEQPAEPRLHVFSSLQRGEDETMPPYPVGMQLSLTCQTAGHRDTYWYEKKDGLNEPVELPSESDSLNGVHWSVYHIQHLSKTDHGREFMCMKDSSTMREDVNLDVVDKPPPPEISTSFDTQVEAEIKCVAEGLSSQLELCWYRGDKRIQCQAPPGGTSPSTQTAVTVRVGLHEILEETHTYLCKPQLRADIDMGSLTQATLYRYEAMFAETSKELQMVSQGAVTCNDTREHVHHLNAEEIVVVKSEKDNSKSCYRVAITENRVQPRPSLVSSTRLYTTPSRSPHVRDQPGDGSPAEDGSPSARACPHQLAALVLLALLLFNAI